MDTVIKNYLFGLKLEEPQQFKNMVVVPLATPLDGGPEYITLKEALEKNLLIITEVSEGGTVPQLKVSNKAEIPVLLLDGEELVGAKQNRVLNTTILLKEKSEMVIPVTCTEQGRWAYVSKTFHDSDTMMSTNLRVMKAQTVSDSLRDSREFRSDQGTVWQGIRQMAEETQAESRTGAMKDVYEAKMAELDEYLKAFACVPQQKGLLAFINGEVVGFDFVSREEAFRVLYPKLVKSYAMEAILQAKSEAPEAKEDADKAFLEEADQCEEKRYESVGIGWDYRFEGKNVVGSALAVEDKVIHMAFFRITESEKAGRIAELRRRRGFRV
jgi:hypothetical protein